jgi:hypothetical protein
MTHSLTTVFLAGALCCAILSLVIPMTAVLVLALLWEGYLFYRAGRV